MMIIRILVTTIETVYFQSGRVTFSLNIHLFFNIVCLCFVEKCGLWTLSVILPCALAFQNVNASILQASSSSCQAATVTV
ncbi:hypothetical protein FKM82_004230 [Ascaphus truei]